MYLTHKYVTHQKCTLLVFSICLVTNENTHTCIGL